MLADVAIIGGTGVGEALGARSGKAVHVPTAEGLLRGRVVEHEGARILLLQRHAQGHKLAPHRVGYAAMALGLKRLQVRACLASAAVGSLRKEWTAGTLVACSDFLDITGRNLTLYSDTVVHTDFSNPFSPKARESLIHAAGKHGHAIEPTGIYICGNGPRYETPHEIRMLSAVGDVIGMTAASEAVLMREAGVEYAVLAVVTNLAAGITESALSHEEVVLEMRRAGAKALDVLLSAAVSLAGEA